VVRTGALGRQQPGDTAGDDGGLPCPRARDNEQRAGVMEDRVALGGRQAVEQRVVW